MADESNETPPNYHLSVSKDFAVTTEKAVKTETYDGDYAELLALMQNEQWAIGIEVQDADLAAFAGSMRKSLAIFVSDVTIKRNPGGRGTLVRKITNLFDVYRLALDFSEVDRNIRTWLAGDTNPPEIPKIRAWESLEPTSAAYQAYKVNGQTLTGNTKKIAEKIAKGVDSYSEYVPVATLTLVSYLTPAAGEDLGRTIQVGQMVSRYAGSNSWPVGKASGSTFDDMLRDVSDKTWVVTSDKVQSNPDGTYTRTIQFSGFDYVDADLYPAVGGAS